jgi:hypothetical protein
MIKFFLSWPLRAHLMLMALLLSLPALAMIVYTGFEKRQDALENGILESKMLVNSVLSEQYNLTGDAEQLVSVLALVPNVRQHNAAAVDAILANILKINRQYSNIIISDVRGEIWASGLPFTGKFSIRNSAVFQKALSTRRFCSGGYVFGRISGKANLEFGYPILDAARVVVGVIAVNVDFEHLNGLLLQSGLPKGSHFTLADRNGVVIYRNLPSGRAAGSPLRESVFRRMTEGSGKVTFLDFGVTEERMINSFGTLHLKVEKAPYLYVLAGIPMDETLLRARHAQFLQVALISPFLLVALLLVTLIGKFCFVNQIDMLQSASERLARGEVGVRFSGYPMGGELGAPGRSR